MDWASRNVLCKEVSYHILFYEDLLCKVICYGCHGYFVIRGLSTMQYTQGTDESEGKKERMNLKCECECERVTVNSIAIRVRVRVHAISRESK